MENTDFEAHIIFDGKLAPFVETLAKHTGWKFSKIDGDPYLGNGVRCYLTTHSADRVDLEQKMRAVVLAAAATGHKALRMKIEQIVFDERF